MCKSVVNFGDKVKYMKDRELLDVVNLLVRVCMVCFTTQQEKDQEK